MEQSFSAESPCTGPSGESGAIPYGSSLPDLQDWLLDDTINAPSSTQEFDSIWGTATVEQNNNDLVLVQQPSGFGNGGNLLDSEATPGGLNTPPPQEFINLEGVSGQGPIGDSSDHCDILNGLDLPPLTTTSKFVNFDPTTQSCQPAGTLGGLEDGSASFSYEVSQSTCDLWEDGVPRDLGVEITNLSPSTLFPEISSQDAFPQTEAAPLNVLDTQHKEETVNQILSFELQTSVTSVTHDHSYEATCVQGEENPSQAEESAIQNDGPGRSKGTDIDGEKDRFSNGKRKSGSLRDTPRKEKRPRVVNFEVSSCEKVATQPDGIDGPGRANAARSDGKNDRFSNGKKKLHMSGPFKDPKKEEQRLRALNAKRNRDRKKVEKFQMEANFSKLKTENGSLRRKAAKYEQRATAAEEKVKRILECLRANGLKLSDAGSSHPTVTKSSVQF